MTISFARFLKISKIMPLILLLFLFLSMRAYSQLSPGDLSDAHSQFEGLSNCTLCHVLGEKVANKKCLDCHKALSRQISKNTGYHSSKEIVNKKCTSCHSEHHGKNFQLIRFDKSHFNHSLTGFELLGAHTKLKCNECHKSGFIKDTEVQKKKFTFLGLDTDCISCHADYHQKTLSTNCKQCHGMKAFKPALKFDHAKTKFKLLGKHKELECAKCHKITEKNGKKFQAFKGIAFEACTSCHQDVHKNKFGPTCTKCHTEQSFNIIKSNSGFNHDRTNFKLLGKHRTVSCKKCHKTNLLDPIKHNQCIDCHADFHKGQFKKQGLTQDCADCHDTKGFTQSSFTIERHDKTDFPLTSAHLATPCFVCHKKTGKWQFSNLGIKCIDCHDNIHKSYLDKKYYPESNCKNCHTSTRWVDINFDHAKTGFDLLGKHKEQSCRTCHFKKLADGKQQQQFKNLTSSCNECHVDKHFKQFDIDGKTDCLSCHNFNNWKAEKFDHNKTGFKLVGKHKDVACAKCHKHKQIGENTFVQYKLNEFRCENCH